MLTVERLGDRWEVCRDGAPQGCVVAIRYAHQGTPENVDMTSEEGDVEVEFEDGTTATARASRDGIEGLKRQLQAAGAAAYEAAMRRMLSGDTAPRGPDSRAGDLA